MMRISAYNQMVKVYGDQSVKKTKATTSVSTASAVDQVSLSTTGRDFQVAKAALSSVPDVREDKVKALKERMANGTYEVSAQDFADKILTAYQNKSV